MWEEDNGWLVYLTVFVAACRHKVALVERQHTILCPFAEPTCWSHKWVSGEAAFRPAPAFSVLVRMSQWAHKQLLFYGHWESHWIVMLAEWICNNDSLEVLTGWGPERGNWDINQGKRERHLRVWGRSEAEWLEHICKRKSSFSWYICFVLQIHLFSRLCGIVSVNV